jgi:predicted amidohydrolase YtcJ
MGPGEEDLAVYQELVEAGELTTRITAYMPIARCERWTAEARSRVDGHLLKVRGVKGFADGSLGSSTALFFEDYLDSPGNRGLAQSDLAAGGDLERRVESCVENGLQVAIHGIGDRAIHLLLDIFQRVSARWPGNHRWRIEHSQHIHPGDLSRFGELGVIASMQPYHAIDDGRWAEKRIGAERAKTTYAFRDLLQRQTVLAFGSDWPVAPLSPILGVYAAVSRRTLDGKHPAGWIPRQKISVEQAVRAYTHGSAYAAGDERELGTLEAGRLADVVVLDTDIFTVSVTEDAEAIRRAKVDLTIVGGRVVHERGEAGRRRR